MPWCEAANLVECVPGWWGVAPTSVPLTNAVKGVACEQRLSHLGMQLKYPIYKELCTLT